MPLNKWLEKISAGNRRVFLSVEPTLENIRLNNDKLFNSLWNGTTLGFALVTQSDFPSRNVFFRD